jgi:Na+(H+)/acetate symporter ActP
VKRPFDKVNFLSLMLALFCGTASLPHILIRYYTVKDASSARKSTIVGITSIGLFYVLTLYLGLGAMTSGTLDVSEENMAAPLLAKGMNTWLFAAISAIAFTTVLGTVSGLILAAAGAVTHDLLSSAFGIQMTDTEKVRVAKMSSVIVGAIRDCSGHSVSENESHVSGRLGVQCCGICQPAIAGDDSVLAKGHEAGNRGRDRRGHGFVHDLDSAER